MTSLGRWHGNGYSNTRVSRFPLELENFSSQFEYKPGCEECIYFEDRFVCYHCNLLNKNFKRGYGKKIYKDIIFDNY